MKRLALVFLISGCTEANQPPAPVEAVAEDDSQREEAYKKEIEELNRKVTVLNDAILKLADAMERKADSDYQIRSKLSDIIENLYAQQQAIIKIQGIDSDQVTSEAEKDLAARREERKDPFTEAEKTLKEIEAKTKDERKQMLEEILSRFKEKNTEAPEK